MAYIAFYYLLRLGEYKIKGIRKNTKRTVQFKMEDTMFSRKDKQVRFEKLPMNETNDKLLHLMEQH